LPLRGGSESVDPSGYLEAKEAKRWDRFCKFGVVAAKQALADSGLEITTPMPTASASASAPASAAS
jgi:3-oxoacyl-(acyl-carrier-protein) synthase